MLAIKHLPLSCAPRCTDESNSQFTGVSGLSGTCFPQNCPFPFWDRHPHITHYSSSQAHSSSQTALSSFQPFLYGFPMLSVQCVVSGEETPKTVPSPWDFVTLPEEDRAIARGNMYKKIWQRSHCFRRYARRQTDRYTHICTHHNTLPHSHGQKIRTRIKNNRFAQKIRCG